MITIMSEPPSVPSDVASTDPHAPPVPLSDKFKWCLQADDADAITTPGGKAQVILIFPSTMTVPADGTEFKIWGRTFTVDSAQNFTSEKVKIVTSGFQTWQNFGQMFLANLYFNRKVTVVPTVVGSTFKITLNWKECREQTAFTAEDMNMDDVPLNSFTYANGASPVYTEGYQLGLAVGYYAERLSGFNPISLIEGFQVDKQCDTVGEFCNRYNDDIQTQLYTKLPELSATSFISAVENGTSLMRFFSLQYGWTYRVDGLSKSGTFMLSDAVLGINAAFDVDDPYQMRRYWYDHPDGFAPNQDACEFLTTQPTKSPILTDAFAWLWLLDNFQTEFGTYTLKANFSIQRAGSAPSTAQVTLDNSSWHRAVCFNVSPARVGALIALNPDEIESFEVFVAGYVSGVFTFVASQIFRFNVKSVCRGFTDLYVLTPAGGIATVAAEILSKEVVRNGTEIYLNVDADASRTNRARYGGRTLVNVRSYEKIEISVRLANNAANYRWLKQVFSSPQHWLRIKDEGGLPLAKKFIIDPDTATILPVQGEALELKATGYFADIPTQTGIEP